ncbi:HTH araC/xylS-type domain-containing protein [Cupriavidus sp. H19C3]
MLMDWLSHLLDIMPVSGRLEIRCVYGAPWRVTYEQSSPGEMPYHVILSGSAILEDGNVREPLYAGDIVMLSHGSAHVLHDGSGVAPAPARHRDTSNIVVSENRGKGERLDMLCGRFVVAPQHDRLVRSYLPGALIVRAGTRGGTQGESAEGSDVSQPSETAAKVIDLVGLMRSESGADSLGGLAMLNSLSAALFALALRLASEAEAAPVGLLALAGHPRLAPALTAMFDNPAHPWTLPELAQRCNMSRATLARHFAEKVGKSANELLTDIRMTLAASELRKPSVSTDAVADLVGYQSVAAFRRAFKDRMGVTPAEWRRGGAAAES